MVFSSIIFLLFFFPVVFTLYRIVPVVLKNWVLLLASMVFYAWGAPKFIFVLLPLTAIDFMIVKKMYGMENGRRKKAWLTFSIFINLGLLAYFKYANFFIENVNAVLLELGASQVQWVHVVLPIGISFFCFETLTYSIDAYRGVIRPLKNLWDYYLYIFLFPKLIAGPIVRFNLIEDQMSADNRKANSNDVILGFWRFTIGLAKKVLIANVMAEKADWYLGGSLNDLSTSTAWLGALAYTFQIYFDFSGYSDMALGMGRMLGFRLPENFDNPYTSKSISEFWRRWHMTLGAWMKEYLYIPLGGNKVNSRRRLYFNLWLVFLISGLWHGASWNFVIWGAYHGLFLILDRLFLVRWLEKMGAAFATLFTFIIVVIGWMFFRLEHFSDAIFVIRKMFSFEFATLPWFELREFNVIFIIATIFAFQTAFQKGKKLQELVYYTTYSTKVNIWISATAMLLFFVAVARVTSSGFNPFIYYRF